ncbi:MAG: glycosyltransferase [Verrucomicrobiaceae bacterium]|nr:glycosyltransferase [Verrucomicrobiaceae bacterium]
MRLTLLIRDLGYAGAQRQLVALAQGLHRAGDSVTVVSFYGGPMQSELEAAGVNVIALGKKSRWDMLGFLWRLVQQIKASRPDVLYSFLNEANLVAALMKPLLPRIRIVWGLRDSKTDAALYGWLGRLVFTLGKFLSRWPDLLIANSHSGARYYATQGYPADRIQVVPNGIDTERFQPNAEARARIRSELGIDDEILFGIVGRLSPMKDYATFLHAAAQVKGKVRFLAIGGGTSDYGDQMRTLAEQLGLASKLLWSAPRSDMPDVFNALDALVSSSAFGEGFSNVAGEAMACGTPCIVTDVGDSARLVADTGLSVPPREPDALAQAMQRFADSVVGHLSEVAGGRLPTSPETHNESSTGPRSLTWATTALGLALPRTRIVEHFTLPLMIERTREVISYPASSIQKPATRVAFLITALGSGGAEMMLTQLITNLDRTRFAPEVISLIPGGKHTDILRAAGIPVHDLGMVAGKPSLASLLKLRRLTKQIEPDLLVGWMYHGNLAATLASWIGHRAPVIWNVRQSLYSLAYEKRGSAMVIKALAHLGFNPQHILYNSQISARQHEAIGYDATKTVLVPNGFNTESFKPDANARASVRQELGLPPDAILIGRFGRNSAMKDYPTFIEAMKLVPNAHAIIAGTGTEELKSLVIGHSSFVILAERHDLPRLTAALDIACSSSAFGEGFPNVVAEAMCSGVPCVVTDVGDSAWLLQDAGKVVPPNNARALAAALNELIALPSHERHALGERGRQRIIDHFSLPAVVAQFESMLSPVHPSSFILHPSSPCVA